MIIVVDSNRVELYTDKLGLRDIYIQEFSDRIVFTTKIKWLTYFSSLAIDLQNLVVDGYYSTKYHKKVFSKISKD